MYTHKCQTPSRANITHLFTQVPAIQRLVGAGYDRPDVPDAVQPAVHVSAAGGARRV